MIPHRRTTPESARAILAGGFRDMPGIIRAFDKAVEAAAKDNRG